MAPRPASIALLALCMSASLSHGANAGARTLAIPRLGSAAAATGGPPGVVVTPFVQRDPHDGVPCSRGTMARVYYDDDELHVEFACDDDAGQVRAHLSKRDDIAGDDQVRVYLDTYGDRQRAYVFACNPLGVQLDGILADGQDEDDDFDTVWYADGRLTPTGWTVTMRIPFRSLRFANTHAQAWGVAFERLIPRTNEECYWPYLTKAVNGLVQQFAITPGSGLIPLKPFQTSGGIITRL